MPWVDVLDRLPDPGRWVRTWGDHCRQDLPPPMAYRRLETPGRPFWFWSGTEWRGCNGISHWWDDAGEATKNVVPTGPGFRPLTGPGDLPVS